LRRLNQLYPSFEGTSGWKADGGYEAMPAAFEARLRAFFRPYNEALYAYLGEDLGWDDAAPQLR
jgi:hypothetical protein